MKGIVRSLLGGLSIVSVFLAIASCSSGRYLRTLYATSAEVTGTYTLVLYGARYSDDIETVAILDKEGDQYTFEVYAPDFDYKIKKGVPAKEALEEAERFVSFHYAFQRSRLSRIVDPAGAAIGYEVRPLYSRLEFGYSDILDIYYLIQGYKVVVRVDLIREVKTRFYDDNSPLPFRGIMRH